MTEVICSYCGKAAQQVSGDVIYPHRPDLKDRQFFLCRPCNAYVGCHKTGEPLGTLANETLRAARKRAHEVFDALWKNDGPMSRTEAYVWLANTLGVDPQKCHIAMFDEAQCSQTVQAVHTLFRTAPGHKPRCVSCGCVLTEDMKCPLWTWHDHYNGVTRKSTSQWCNSENDK